MTDTNNITEGYYNKRIEIISIIMNTIREMDSISTELKNTDPITSDKISRISMALAHLISAATILTDEKLMPPANLLITTSLIILTDLTNKNANAVTKSLKALAMDRDLLNEVSKLYEIMG